MSYKDDFQRLQDGGSEQWVDAMAAYIDWQLATGSYPHMVRIVGREGGRAAIDRLVALGGDEQRFERAIKRLLDGIALSLS